jgi:hypothetical protein
MKLVWSRTGDELVLDVLNHNLFYYWIEQLETRNLNSFRLEPARIYTIAIKSGFIPKLVEKVNTRLPEDKLPLGDCLDQNYLNELHREWVKLQLRRPAVKSYLQLKDTDAAQAFDNINRELHELERLCKYFYQTASPTTVFENPFVQDIEAMTRSHSHIFVSYKNLGRTAWHKWCSGDLNLSDSDTNEYDTIGTDIILDVNPSNGLTLPDAYIQACKSAGVAAVGPELGLARFNLDHGWARVHTLLRRNSQAGTEMKFIS